MISGMRRTGKGRIPIGEFFDVVGKRYCMVFSARERSLLSLHIDKDQDGTIDYKEFLDKFAEPADFYAKEALPMVPQVQNKNVGADNATKQSATGATAWAEARRTMNEAESAELAKQIAGNKAITMKIRQKLHARGLRLACVFKSIDSNGDGFLTSNELKVGLKRMQFNLTDAELSSLVDYVDSGGESGGGMLG